MSEAIANPIFPVAEVELGSCIFSEGQRRTHSEFFIILEGTVEIRKFDLSQNKYVTLKLSKGDFIGVISAMANLPELESAFALTPLRLICIPKENFNL